MNKKIKKLVQVVLVIAVGALALRLLAQTCLTTTVAFTENFSGTNYENLTAGVNSVSGWPPGPIQLNKLGANFTLSMPATQGAEIYCCLTSAKFRQGLISPKLWFPIARPS